MIARDYGDHHCKNGMHLCGVMWTCGKCTAELHAQIRLQQTTKQQAYDDMVELGDGREDDCCLCHINPPCSFCTREWDCECEGNHADGHALGCSEEGDELEARSGVTS